MKQYDAIIIGFGKGGKLLAAELANRNWKVAIIERSSQMYGGTCVNAGCIPTKTLIHESEQAPPREHPPHPSQILHIRRKPEKQARIIPAGQEPRASEKLPQHHAVRR